jgi:hypothetical protein
MFEYRISDPASPRYGEIDKPTFLWAGGWYLYTLYELCGVRENALNISLCPNLPQDLADLEYDLAAGGKLCRISWKGTGDYFRSIEIDGRKSHSAVLIAPVSEIALERGIPDEPYLAASDCIVRNVSYSQDSEETLTVLLSGLKDQTGSVKIVCPGLPRKILLNGSPASEEMVVKDEREAYTIKCSFSLQATETTIEFIF